MTPVINRYPRNQDGRDFVVGDIHGMFARVDRALAALRFDPARDRLFSVGDLIDRGPESQRALEFLARPWVHAVRGNHEDMLLTEQTTREAMRHPTTWGNGSDWWKTVPAEFRKELRTALKRLPLVIEVETDRGTVGILHGEVPVGLDWPTFCTRLETGDARVTETALWGRDRIDFNVQDRIPGIWHLFVGHNIQWDGPRQYGNVFAVDTGAVFPMDGGRLTMVNIELSSADVLTGSNSEK